MKACKREIKTVLNTNNMVRTLMYCNTLRKISNGRHTVYCIRKGWGMLVVLVSGVNFRSWS